MDTLYIETTVVGNIAGRLHPDAIIAARQQLTREWWAAASGRYRMFVSQLTFDECGDGDPTAAMERLQVIEGLEVLEITTEAEDLADLLVKRLAVPASQPRDALHIAVAAAHLVQFIVTWNFKHILNPHLQVRIADTCREAGFPSPVICTPQQLLEAENGA